MLNLRAGTARRLRSRRAITLTCALALAFAGTAGQAAAGTTPGRVTLTGTNQGAFGLTDNGPVPVGTPVSENIYLAVKNPAALAAAAKAMSDPDDPGYRRFMSQDQIREAEELDPAQLDLVRRWLTASGLKVSQPNWQSLRVTGTFGQLDAAFAVTFHDYTYPAQDHIQGRYLISPTDLSVPADLGALVLGVGQDTFLEVSPGEATLERPAANHSYLDAGTAATCSKYWGQLPATGLPKVNGTTPPLAPCGYTPTQLRHAYGFDQTGLTGAGQTVAVLASEMSTIGQDINTWSKSVGTPPLRHGQLTVVPTPDGSPAENPANPVYGYSGMIEGTIDAEAVHGIAPGANIITVGDSTAQGSSLLDSMIYVLDRTRASIVSSSQSLLLPPGMEQAYDEILQEGALQGVGFYWCAGDGGVRPNANGDDFLFITNSSWVTIVGGTSLAIGPDGRREWETGWGDPTSQLSADGTSWQTPEITAASGTSGGRTTAVPEPWYQYGVVPESTATGINGSPNRVGPDVAMDADPSTGMITGGTALDGSSTTNPGTWHYIQHTYGGTSLSTPLFAGVQALAQQADGGERFGFANPMLYQRANTSAFRDVRAYTLPDGSAPTAVRYVPNGTGGSTPVLYYYRAADYLGPQDGVIPPTVRPGFDTETGLGTPTGSYLSSFDRASSTE
jgi:subtilase family serine protease